MTVTRQVQLVLERLFDGNDVYILSESGVASSVDKLSFKGNKVARSRYVVSYPDSTCTCTCKGYVHRGRCKHVAMVEDDWEATGAPRHHVIELVKDIVHELGTSAAHLELDEETVPKMLKKVTIRLTNLNKNVTILVNRDFGDKESCAFIFKS